MTAVTNRNTQARQKMNIAVRKSTIGEEGCGDNLDKDL
jgi:hypothetical protein